MFPLPHAVDAKMIDRRGPFFCSTRAASILPFSNRRHERKHFLLADLLSCLGPFFCSTAPQAFFRPDRRFPTPARAEAVKAGRRSLIAAHSAVSRPRLDSFEHGGRLDNRGPEERSVVEGAPFGFACVN
jgi:hypothetical protein